MGRQRGEGRQSSSEATAGRRGNKASQAARNTPATSGDREEKTCASCGRRIEWRAAWAKNWPAIRYCSDACRSRKVRPVDRALERSILSLLAQRSRDGSICPSEAARAVAEAAGVSARGAQSAADHSAVSGVDRGAGRETHPGADRTPNRGAHPGAGATANSPSDDATANSPADDAWRALMEPARRAARRLVAASEVEITQGGRVVDPSTAKGAIRVRRAR